MIVFRTVLFYAVLLIQIRMMGKRQLGQMEPSEFVVAILIANLAAIPLENPQHSVWSGLIPMGIILVLERGLSWLCLKSIPMRRLLCGKPVILIDNGKILWDNLRRTRVNLDELSECLREQGYLELEAIQFAILETSGNLSVFPYPEQAPAAARDAGIRPPAREMPYTIISDGFLLKENLHMLGRDEAWLRALLKKKKCAQSDVMLLTACQSGRTCLILRPSDSGNH